MHHHLNEKTFPRDHGHCCLRRLIHGVAVSRDTTICFFCVYLAFVCSSFFVSD